MPVQLLSGNEAVALAALHAGVALGAGYPGTPSTEILEHFYAIGGHAEWSPNEKVAFEVALGAAFGGAAAIVTMKHVGLNVAADPLFTAAYSGVAGALVVVSADDPGMASSQNEQDNRRYAVAAALPMFEPADSQEAYDFTLAAFELSTRWKLPVLLRMTTRVCHSKTLVRPQAPVAEEGREEKGEGKAISRQWSVASRQQINNQQSTINNSSPLAPRPSPLASFPLVPHFERDIRSRVMIPAHARPAHHRLRQKLAEIAAWNETCPCNQLIAEKGREERGEGRGERGEVTSGQPPVGSKSAINNQQSTIPRPLPLGIITSGITFMHVREAAPDAAVLKLGLTYPLPLEKICQFAAGVERCLIVEEGDPYLFEQIRAAGIEVDQKPEMFRFGELDVSRVRRILAGDTSPEAALPPGKPPALCVSCPHRITFELLRKLDCIVAGDIGCYTLGALPPFEGMDSQLCMGASIGMGLGLRHVLPEQQARRVVSVIGDSTFVHSGITGLVEMIYNPPPTGHVVLILDNGTTAMTGLQEHPATGRTLGHEPTGRLVIEDLTRSLGVANVVVIDPTANTETFEQVVRDALGRNELSVIVARRVCLLAAGKIKKAEKGREERGEGRGEKKEVVSGQWSVASEEALRAKEQQHGLQYVNLMGVSISPCVLELMPEAVARENTAIPVSESEGKLTVVVSDPLDYDKFDRLRFRLNRQIEIALAPSEAILKAIDRHYGQTVGAQSPIPNPQSLVPRPSPLAPLPAPLSVVIAGLGGQGVLLASDILAEAAFLAGYDVKKSEVHGMSQRGGSVASDVRFGTTVFSPMVPPAEADFLVVLAEDQIDNNRPRLREGGVLIGPSDIQADLLPNRRSANVALLGVLSRHLKIDAATWLEAVRRNMKPELYEVNRQAFEIGRNGATG